MTAALLTRSAAELGRLMAAGELTSEELTRACLAQIEALNPRLNVFLAVEADVGAAALALQVMGKQIAIGIHVVHDEDAGSGEQAVMVR